MITHPNTKYGNISGSDVPLASGDRQWAQEKMRNFHALLDRAGRLTNSILQKGVSNSIIERGDIAQGAIDTIDVGKTAGIVKQSVDVPDSFVGEPPTVTQEDIYQFVEIPADLTNQAITGGQINDNLYANATLDGVTVNYVKLKYKEIDGATRSRSEGTGSYVYQVTPSYEVRIEPVAATSYELTLSSFTGTAGNPLTFDHSVRDDDGFEFLRTVPGSSGIEIWPDEILYNARAVGANHYYKNAGWAFRELVDPSTGSYIIYQSNVSGAAFSQVASWVELMSFDATTGVTSIASLDIGSLIGTTSLAAGASIDGAGSTIDDGGIDIKAGKTMSLLAGANIDGAGSTIDDNGIDIKSGNNLQHNSIPVSGYISSGTSPVYQSYPSGAAIRTDIINMGTWNMDTTASISVSHSYTISKIIGLHAIIRGDNGNTFQPISGDGTGSGAGWIQMNSSNIALYRTTGGVFDNTGFDDTTVSRGVVVVQYID